MDNGSSEGKIFTGNRGADSADVARMPRSNCWPAMSSSVIVVVVARCQLGWGGWLYVWWHNSGAVVIQMERGREGKDPQQNMRVFVSLLPGASERHSTAGASQHCIGGWKESHLTSTYLTHLIKHRQH